MTTKDMGTVLGIMAIIALIAGGLILGLYKASHVVTIPQMTITEYIDPDTKVHYFCRSDGGMTVRYNADGTIMVD